MQFFVRFDFDSTEILTKHFYKSNSPGLVITKVLRSQEFVHYYMYILEFGVRALISYIQCLLHYQFSPVLHWIIFYRNVDLFRQAMKKKTYQKLCLP